MDVLAHIKEPVADEIGRYEEFLRQALVSEIGSVTEMVDYVFTNRGKGIRPLLTILSASLNNDGKELPRQSHIAAMLLEMIHTATLVHDDVIDDSDTRRAKPSANSRWGSHNAVLVGDYILAKSYEFSMVSGAYELTTYISRCMGEICEGELLQSIHAGALDTDKGIYEKIIRKKTAVLLGISAGAGALSVATAPDRVEAMRRFGENLGMAFQIKDDILDYSPSSVTGKPSGNDLHERKITLPLICVMEKSSPDQNREIVSLLSGIRANPGNAELITKIVVDGNGIAEATAIMNGYISDAKEILSAYPGSPIRDAMSLLCDFIGGREK